MKTKAFTLMELLVAMAVFSLLVVMLMGVVDSATKLWRNSEKQVETLREARAALHMMSGELACLVIATNANYSKDFFHISPLPSGAKNNSELGFVTALPLSSQNTTNQSDLCLVAYFVAKGKSSDFSTNESQNLYRYFLDSGTLTGRLTNEPPKKDFWSSLQATDPNSEIVAKNIQAFRVRPYYQDTTTPNGTWTDWKQPDADPNDLAGAWKPGEPGNVPQLLELELVVADSEIVKRVGGTNLAEIPPEFLRTVTTHVALDRNGGVPTGARIHPSPTP